MLDTRFFLLLLLLSFMIISANPRSCNLNPNNKLFCVYEKCNIYNSIQFN